MKLLFILTYAARFYSNAKFENVLLLLWLVSFGVSSSLVGIYIALKVIVYTLSSLFILTKNEFKLPRDISFFLFALYIAVTAFWSDRMLFGLIKSIDLFLVLLFIYSLADYNKNAERILFILDFAILAALIELAFNFGKYYSSSLVLESFWPRVTPNTLSFCCLLRVILSLEMKRYGIQSIVIPLIVLIFAHSRTSLFILGAYVMVTALRKRGALFQALIFFVGVLSFFFVNEIKDYFFRGQTTEQFASMSGRTFIWEAVLEKSKNKPVLGHGYFASFDFNSAFYLDGLASNSDNAFLDVFFYGGFLGLFLFLMSFYNGFFKGSPLIYKVIGLAFLVKGLTGNIFQIPNMFLLVFLLFTLNKR